MPHHAAHVNSDRCANAAPLHFMASEPSSPSEAQPGGGLTYRSAGVDIDAGDRLVDGIRQIARRTLRDGVLAGIGGFGALFEVPKKFRNPVLVSSTDGVGTKL